VYQLLAHICTLEFDDTEGIKTLIMPFAVKSHRAVDLGLKEGAE
jgi:chaperone required for assembly of F1-ATPase